MKTLKHKKHRNTGLIWELLCRQMTADVLEEKENSPAARILKEYFGNPNSDLTKELQLYHVVLKEKFETEQQAQDLIKEVLKAHEKNVDNERLEEEKYAVVGAIKEEFGIKPFFSNRVRNYTELASAYKLLESSREDVEATPADVVRSRYTLVEHITKEGEEDPEPSGFSQEKDKDIQALAHRIMVEKFNERYGSLSERQTDVLRAFVSSMSDSKGFREFVNEEAERVRESFQKILESRDSLADVVKIKLQEATQLVGKLIHENTTKVREDEVTNLLLYLQLEREVS